MRLSPASGGGVAGFDPAEPDAPAVQIYRDRPGHLADVGGGYMVLPGPATSAGLRTQRAKRMIETHRRRVHLAEHARTADTAMGRRHHRGRPVVGSGRR